MYIYSLAIVFRYYVCFYLCATGFGELNIYILYLVVLSDRIRLCTTTAQDVSATVLGSRQTMNGLHGTVYPCTAT